MDRELRDLIMAAQEETISPEDFAVLENRLRESKADRETFLRFQQMQSLLESSPPSAETLGLDDSADRVQRVNFFQRTAPIAIAAALIFLFAWVWNSRTSSPGSSEQVAMQVATLLLDEGCQWDADNYTEGSRLNPGLIDLEIGTAVIRFDGGAELIMTGPSQVDLLTPMSASLLSGEVVIRAEEGAEGFRLNTPSGDLIDLGTEFAVKIDKQGDTELHVHEGEVAVGSSPESPSVITEGHAVRLSSKGDHALSDMPIDAPRFEELIARAAPKERRDLMTAYEGFHVEEGEYKAYQLNGGQGWAGPWRLRRGEEFGNTPEDSSRKMTIAHSQMDIAWPIRGGQLGMLEMPSGSNVRMRKLKNSVNMSRWGHQYLSFLVTETTGKPDRTEGGKQGRSDIRFTLRSSNDYFGESISIGWERSRFPRVSVGNGPTVRSTRAIPEGQTVFCVAKITSRKTGRDEIRFRFYTREDDLDLLEPAEWDVVLTGQDLSANLDLLLLTSHSHQKRYVDEIRMGPTWRSVTPIYLSREMKSLELSSR